MREGQFSRARRERIPRPGRTTAHVLTHGHTVETGLKTGAARMDREPPPARAALPSWALLSSIPHASGPSPNNIFAGSDLGPATCGGIAEASEVGLCKN